VATVARTRRDGSCAHVERHLARGGESSFQPKTFMPAKANCSGLAPLRRGARHDSPPRRKSRTRPRRRPWWPTEVDARRCRHARSLRCRPHDVATKLFAQAPQVGSALQLLLHRRVRVMMRDIVTARVPISTVPIDMPIATQSACSRREPIASGSWLALVGFVGSHTARSSAEPAHRFGRPIIQVISTRTCLADGPDSSGVSTDR